MKLIIHVKRDIALLYKSSAVSNYIFNAKLYEKKRVCKPLTHTFSYSSKNNKCTLPFFAVKKTQSHDTLIRNVTRYQQPF